MKTLVYEDLPTMQGVHQDIFGATRPFSDTNRPGNCTQACVATILGRALDQVPHFVELTIGDPRTGAWGPALSSWMRDEYGPDYGWTWYDADEWRAAVPDATSEQLARLFGLGGGIGRCSGKSHHVVVDGNLELIWDPNPNALGDQAGLIEVLSFDVPVLWISDGLCDPQTFVRRPLSLDSGDSA